MIRGDACDREIWPQGEPLGLCTALIALGGFHYGYNVAVVGVAKEGIVAWLEPTVSTFSLLSSSALLGAVVGSPVSGLVCSRLGRVPS